MKINQNLVCGALLFLMFVTSTSLSAQYSLGGTTDVYVGGSGFYFVNSSGGASITSTNWSVTPPGSASVSPQGTSQASITFNAVGVYAVSASGSTTSGSYSTEEYQVVVSNPPAPDPDDPEVNPASLTCGNATLEVDHANKPSNVTWYWQGQNSNSFLTNLGSGETFTATQSGTYYIRARYNSTLEWSNGVGSVGVTITTSTNTPNAVADNSTVCSGNGTFITASGVSGATYRWYDANDNYLNFAGNVYGTGNLTQTTTFKVSATINGCESPKRSVTVTATSPPTAYTLSPEDSQICANKSGKLTLSDSQAGVSYQLIRGTSTQVGSARTSNDGPIVWDTNITAGNYKVQASNINGSCSIIESNTVSITNRSATEIVISTDQNNNDQICPDVTQINLVAQNIGTNGIIAWLDSNSNTIGSSTTQLVSINPGTTNTFTLRAWNDCDQIVETPVTLTMLPAMGQVSAPDGEFSRCGGEGNNTYTASATNATNYTWDLTPGAGTITNSGYVEWNPTFSGNATITVTAHGTCGQSDTKSETVTVVQQVTYYLDEDRDGYHDGIVEACSNPDPVRYVTSGIIGSGDCDDENFGINPATEWFLDADKDRYPADNQVTVGCLSPGPDYNYGYKATVLDCDDTNENVRSIRWYEDTDNDGLGEPDGNMLQQCDEPLVGNYVDNNNDLCPSDPLNICGSASSGILCDTDNLNLTVTGDNHVYSRTYQSATATALSFFQANDDVIQQIAYFDGLGRPVQQVAIDQSPSKNDIVTHIGYDGFGRQEKEWLPYADIDPLAGIGSFRSGAEAATDTYYVQNYGQDIDANAPNPYSQKGFDQSPLSRVLQQAAPGSDWALGGGHEIEFGYDTNVASDNIRQFVVDLNFADNTYASTLVYQKDDQNVDIEFYASGELYKNITKDENHDGTTSKLHTTEEFTDKQGRVVLKRTYAEVGSPSVVEAHDTYYVYDDFGNLTYVLSPKMDASSATLANINTNMNELGYQYVYDHRNRLVEKKIPGKGWEYIVYNKLNQPILTQDALQRANNTWLFTKYDAFGRVAYTGKATSPANTTRTAVQAEVDGLSGNLWVSQGTQTNFGGTDIFYDNGAYPTQLTTQAQLSENLTINYYDDYAFVPGTWPTVPTSAFAENIDVDVKSLATGTRVKVLDQTPAQWITTATYYDDRGRPIYTYSENEYLGTVDVVETELDFVARPTRVRSAHTRDGVTIVTLDNFEYDHVGRLLKQTQCVGDETLGETCEAATIVDLVLQNTTVTTDQSAQKSITVEATTEITNGVLEVTGNGGQEELIAANEYDNLGQLIKKNVGNTVASPLQEVDYTYNVRGWLKTINQDANNDNDLFNFGINYNTVVHGGTPLFNGNIAETEWETANDNVQRWYHYGYDALNRITDATSYNGNYNVSNITYDRNGNIGKLQRQGAAGLMDNLTYSYHSTEVSNRLRTVADASGIADGFADGSNSGDDYAYDANGNMTMDLNKGIQADGITYNHLNLPNSVTLPGGTISYIYDAAGTKLKKTAEGSVTEYAGNYVYSGNTTVTTLQFFNQPEGYVTPSAVEGSYNYVYQYKDHLGNIRLSFSDGNGDGDIDVTSDPLTTEIVEENNYYPFGLKHKGYNIGGATSLGNDVANRWKFGGKEYQEELDLAWYDVTARNYDPALGRWMNIDPLAEQMRRHSPYNYAFNSPMYFVDPDGMAPDDYYDQDGNWLGASDKNYVVTDATDITTIKNNTATGKKTSLSELSGTQEELPSQMVRNEMKKSVANSNNPTTSADNPDPSFKPDTKGGFHEEGGLFGKDSNGNEMVEHVYPGSASDPSTDATASVSVNPKDAKDGSFDLDANEGVISRWHVHPAGDQSSGKFFGQRPSGYIFPKKSDGSPGAIITGDLPGSTGSRQTNFVLAAGPKLFGGQKVYIYRNGEVKASFPLSKFFSISD